MGYPTEFSSSARARIEAETLKARRIFEEQRSKFSGRAGRSNQENLHKYILQVFVAFAIEACKLGSERLWTVDRIRSESEEFLRIFTIKAESEDAGGLRMTSNWDGSLLPQVKQEYRKSAEWQQYEDKLLEVVEETARDDQPSAPAALDKPPNTSASAVAQNAGQSMAMREAIQKKKARIELIDRSLDRLPPSGVSEINGKPVRITGGSVQRLIEERMHLEHASAELEAEEARLARSRMIPSYVWEQVDHALANLMLTELSQEIQSTIRKDEQQIRFSNRGNENRLTVPSQRLESQLRRTDEWAQRIYELYRDVWRRQGNTESPELLRAIFAHGITTLVSARTASAIAELVLEGQRTQAYPAEWLNAAIAEFRRSMERLASSWQRRVEIDAKTLEHSQAAVKPIKHIAPDNELPATEKVQSPADPVSEKDKRSALVDAFLAKCNSDPGAEPKIIRKHIWQVVGHTHPRQFQYWQSAQDRLSDNNRGATRQDDINFRRILNLSPMEFRTLLQKKNVD